MLLKKNAELLRMPTVLLSASKMCKENTCRSTLLGARVAPSSRADVACTVVRLTAAMFANRTLGWIEGSQVDGEDEAARAPPNIATKCMHVIRNPRLPVQSRERCRKINSRKLIALARTVLGSSTSDDRSTAAKLREKIWSGIPPCPSWSALGRPRFGNIDSAIFAASEATTAIKKRHDHSIFIKLTSILN